MIIKRTVPLNVISIFSRSREGIYYYVVEILTQIAHHQARYGEPKKKLRLFIMVYRIRVAR